MPENRPLKTKMAFLVASLFNCHSPQLKLEPFSLSPNLPSSLCATTTTTTTTIHKRLGNIQLLVKV